MRELNFATEQSIAEAFEEIKENFEPDVEVVVEGDIKETLNKLLLVDAWRQLGAGWYERAIERLGYRCGTRPRRLVTTKGTYDLKVPRARGIRLEFRAFDRYRRMWKQVDRIPRVRPMLAQLGCKFSKFGDRVAFALALTSLFHIEYDPAQEHGRT